MGDARAPSLEGDVDVGGCLCVAGGFPGAAHWVLCLMLLIGVLCLMLLKMPAHCIWCFAAHGGVFLLFIMISACLLLLMMLCVVHLAGVALVRDLSQVDTAGILACTSLYQPVRACKGL